MSDYLTLSAEPYLDEVSRSYVFDILDDKCYEVVGKPDGTFLVGVVYFETSKTLN